MNEEIIIETKEYSTDFTFNCGQCFRWERDDDGFLGIVGDQVAKVIEIKKGTLKIAGKLTKDKDFWNHYLGIGEKGADDAYLAAVERLKRLDPIMKSAVRYSPGLHLLKQEFYETVFSFIISANNNVTRIKGIVLGLCNSYGKFICEWKGKKMYSFPDVSVLADLRENDLRNIGAGYRAPYLIKAANQLASKLFSPNDLMNCSLYEARSKISILAGVGPKVADCILLFSGLRNDVFPTDIWVRRVMEELYFKKAVTSDEVTKFASDYFGMDAGLAQQFLFHYARMKKIGKTN